VRILEHLGYYVDVVENGAEAVSAVVRFSYGAVTLSPGDGLRGPG
jgi:hypothetical protein